LRDKRFIYFYIKIQYRKVKFYNRYSYQSSPDFSWSTWRKSKFMCEAQNVIKCRLNPSSTRLSAPRWEIVSLIVGQRLEMSALPTISQQRFPNDGPTISQRWTNHNSSTLGQQQFSNVTPSLPYCWLANTQFPNVGSITTPRLRATHISQHWEIVVLPTHNFPTMSTNSQRWTNYVCYLGNDKDINITDQIYRCTGNDSGWSHL